MDIWEDFTWTKIYDGGSYAKEEKKAAKDIYKDR